jgi:hypothetical protein
LLRGDAKLGPPFEAIVFKKQHPIVFKKPHPIIFKKQQVVLPAMTTSQYTDGSVNNPVGPSI